MKKLLKLLTCIIVALGIMFSTIHFADVGNYESYDSDWGSDWDSDWGSDWDSDWGSDWDSDWGSDYDWDSDGLGLGSLLFLINNPVVLIVVIVFIIFLKRSNKGSSTSQAAPIYRPSNTGYLRNQARHNGVVEKIKEIDPQFNDTKFLAWEKDIFIKLQNAWTNRDWEEIRVFESEDLFEIHQKQLQEYIDTKRINIMERISVNYAEFIMFKQDNEKDILVTALNSSMNDYIIDEETKEVVKGDKNRRYTNTYKLTFTRKKGVLTEEGTDKLKTTNCPNCGAPTKITSSGKCEFCNSVITIGSHDWVLTDMERM